MELISLFTLEASLADVSGGSVSGERINGSVKGSNTAEVR